MATPLKLGMVGLGRAGWGMHCPELEDKKDYFQIVAACDVIPERTQAMKERYGCKTYGRIEDLLADPEVEVVDLATRSVDHFAHVKLALAAGKYVFDEKPMCVTYEQAQELKRLSEEAGDKLFIRHNRRFEPGFNKVKEIIASGILGEVFEIKLRRTHFARREDWQTLKRFGGGQLLNWGPHIIDHALRLIEAEIVEFKSYLAKVAALGDAEDHLKLLFKGANGRVIDLEISGGAALTPEPEYLVWGTRGALSCTGDTVNLRYIDPDQQLKHREADPGTPPQDMPFHLGRKGLTEPLNWVEETLEADPEGKWNMSNIWIALYEAIREGKPYPIPLEQAVEVMKYVSLAKQGTEFENTGPEASLD